MDLLARARPSRAVAQTPGAGRHTMGQARVASEGNAPTWPAPGTLARVVLPLELGGNPGPLARPPLSPGSDVLLRQLCAVRRIHETARSGGAARPHRANRGSIRRAAVGVRETVLAKASLAVVRLTTGPRARPDGIHSPRLGRNDILLTGRPA